MKNKTILAVALILFLAATIILPISVLAVYNTVNIGDDTNVDLWGVSRTLTLKSGGNVAGFTVYSTYLSVDLESGSSLTIVSDNGYMMTSSPDVGTFICDTPAFGKSQMTLTSTTTQTVTITPSASTCSVNWGSGSSGSSSTTTTTTTTTTNTQTATASGGGTTTLTTRDNTTATAELPANAVTSSTDIKITAENRTSVVASQPAPSGQSVVGNYVYNFTATSGGTSITTFSKDITLTFTYADNQITGLNEDSLKAYYWNGSAWTGLTSVVDKVNNKITATTNHFTYFAIMGESTTPTGTANPSDYGLKEGDLIRAEGDFDIFIINQYGYKRLFLNPAIFNMYGHLGGWKTVKTVTTATRDAFITSKYFRYVDSPKVYYVEVSGEDTGILHWINMTGEDFLSQGGKSEAIFIINKSEFDWYPKGVEKTSL